MIIQNTKLRGKDLENYKKTLKLSDLQKDILVGTLLGDASMSLRKGRPTYSIKFEQGEKNQAYIYHLYEIFQPFTGTAPVYRFIDKEKTRRSIWFRTYRHNSLIFYYNLFYKQNYSLENPNFVESKVKIIPKNIHKFLTARALAYWFMDDGTFNIDLKTGKKNYLFSSQAYEKHENLRLCEALHRNFGIKASVHKDKNKWRIYVHSESSKTFKEIVSLYIHEKFVYKL